MMDFVICVDSTADMNADMRKEYGIEYFKMGFSGDDGEREADLNWSDEQYSEFYNSMRAGKRYKTVQVPAAVFTKQMEEYLKAGFDILYIACSSALSGSVNTAQMVAGELKAKYPERQVLCVDSLISTLAQGALAIKASEMRAEGKYIEEVYAYIEENKMFCNYVSSVETLSYLKDAGRVSATSSFFGNLFGVKPILVSNALGQNEAVKKVKGRKAALAEIADILARRITDAAGQVIYITHADDYDAAKELQSLIEERVEGAVIKIGFIGPIVGISVGPGTLIASYMGVDKSLPTVE